MPDLETDLDVDHISGLTRAVVVHDLVEEVVEAEARTDGWAGLA
jgi:hypothetical protein